jgi:hypothetical protein
MSSRKYYPAQVRISFLARKLLIRIEFLILYAVFYVNVECAFEMMGVYICSVHLQFILQNLLIQLQMQKHCEQQ